MPTKTKSRSNPTPLGGSYESDLVLVNAPFTRTPSNSGTYPDTYGQDSAVISYDDGDARGMKNCTHVTSKSQFLHCDGCAYLDSTRDIDFTNFGLWGLDFLSLGKTSFEPTSTNLSSFSARAFQAMEPSFEGDMHLTNFVLELHDIKRLLTLGSKWVGYVKNWRRTEAFLTRTPQLQIAKAIAKEVANGHLSMSFGIKPFMRDVVTMFDSLTVWSDRIADFLAKRRIPQVRHYYEVLNDDVVSQDDGQIGASSIFREVVSTGKVEAWATMYYSYDCPDVVELGQKIEVLRDLLGLRFGFAQIWEAIPFSFVVDWFIKIQDFLEQFNKPLFGVKLTVTDFCISHKVTSVTEAIINTTGSRIGPNVNNHVAGRNVYKKYVRRLQAPNSGISFLNMGQYGPNQLALSASLMMGLTKVHSI